MTMYAVYVNFSTSELFLEGSATGCALHITYGLYGEVLFTWTWEEGELLLTASC